MNVLDLMAITGGSALAIPAAKKDNRLAKAGLVGLGATGIGFDIAQASKGKHFWRALARNKKLSIPTAVIPGAAYIAAKYIGKKKDK